jgi:hypothetical protein
VDILYTNIGRQDGENAYLLKTSMTLIPSRHCPVTGHASLERHDLHHAQAKANSGLSALQTPQDSLRGTSGCCDMLALQELEACQLGLYDF